MLGCKRLALIGLLLAACGSPAGVVVDIGAWPEGATSLQVRGTLNEESAREPLSFPAGTTRFVVYLPEGRSGHVGVQVRAIDDSDCARAAGSVQVDVPAGLRALAEADIALTTIAPPACPGPVLQQITPEVGPTAGGTALTLIGEHFIAGATLLIDGVPARDVVWQSAARLTATLPADPGGFGWVPVVLRNPDGQQARRSDVFAYYASLFALSSMASFATDKLPASVTTADFNGDHILDLVTANAQSTVSLLLGDGRGGFGSARHLGSYPNASAVATGDFNGDHKTDLAVVAYGSNSVNILLGDGSGGLAFSTAIPGIGIPGHLAIADINHDQVSDLVVTSGFTSAVQVVLGNSKGGFGPPTAFPTGPSPVGVAVGDAIGI